MTRIRVDVTAEDIAAGVRGSTDACPVALALRRSGFPEATIGCAFWQPDGDFDIGSLSTSDKAAAWITDFAYGEPVEPATFYFEGPDA